MTPMPPESVLSLLGPGPLARQVVQVSRKNQEWLRERSDHINQAGWGVGTAGGLVRQRVLGRFARNEHINQGAMGLAKHINQAGWGDGVGLGARHVGDAEKETRDDFDGEAADL